MTLAYKKATSCYVIKKSLADVAWRMLNWRVSHLHVNTLGLGYAKR